MKSRELRQQRAKLVEDARALLDAVPAGEAVSDEINAKFDEMIAASDKLKEQIDRIERLEDLENHMTQRIERRAGREDISVDEAAEKTALETRAFQAYIRGGMANIPADLRDVANQRFMNAQSTTSGPEGGYLIPEGPLQQIVSAELAYGGMLGVSTIFDTSTGNMIPIPIENDTSNKGRILNENTVVSDTSVTFGVVQMSAYSYTTDMIKVPNQLLTDAAFDLGGFINRKFAERMARILNDHFTFGTGANQPVGIVTGATLGVTAASSSAVTFDEVAYDLPHTVDPAYRMNAQFMFADSTLKVLKKMKNGEGDYLWSSGVMIREPDMIAGYRYTINQSMDALGSGKKPILFGDLSKYMVRRVAGAQLLRLNERFADYNQVAFLGFQRWDGNLIDAGTHPVKYLTM